MIHRRNRFTPLALALLLATLALPSASRATAPAATTPLPRLLSDSTRIEADDDFTWVLPLRLANPLGVGLYLDSMSCEVLDLGPGETRAGRTTVLDLAGVVQVVGSVGAGDTAQLGCTAGALAEHARLTFRLRLHRADHVTYTLTTEVEALPGPVSREHPSQFIEAGGRRVETVLLSAARDSGLAPGLLMVHGHANHARRMLHSAQTLAARGYTVMLVSMPGYGQSDGPADFMGPATLRAASAALDRLKASPGVDPKRLAAWGVSRGATVVTLLAQRRGGLAAVIAQSGIYDQWAAYRGTKIPGIRENMEREIGPDSSAWRERSPALDPARPAAAFLILHGEKDPRVPVEQARAFSATLVARGATVETRFFPEAQHQLPPSVVLRAALDFLGRRLAP